MNTKPITILTLLANLSCFAQIPDLSMPKVVPPSPEAVKLAEYINYPDDLCNGLVQISIPLYEVVDGDIRIPITLNYHASGIKPNQHSGNWLGNGWSLSTGPSLSRSINGGADEFFYWKEMLDCSAPTNQQKKQITDHVRDAALDEFYYSIPEHSGRMYFKRLEHDVLHPVTIPRAPVKVGFPDANRYDNFIDIIDTKGMVYHFGGAERRFSKSRRAPSTYGNASSTASPLCSVDVDFPTGTLNVSDN